jgi:hypothetical protein
MMKSRALPDNFDMTPSLHGNYGATPGGITPGASPGSYGQLPHGHIRPLTLDTLRRENIGPAYVSPTGIPPGMTSMACTPPHSATDTMSPVARPHEGGAFGYNSRSILDSPQRAMFPGPPSSYSSQYSQSHRLPAHDRFRRTSGETAASSPLRSNMSYGSLGGEGSQHQSEARTPGLQASDGPSYISQQDSQRNMPPPSGPYGLGLSSCKSLVLVDSSSDSANVMSRWLPKLSIQRAPGPGANEQSTKH